MDTHTPDQDEPQTLAALYALGALDIVETAELTAALQADATLGRDLHAFEQVVQMLGYGTPPITPPEDVQTRLLANIQTCSQEASPAVPPQTYDASKPFILHANEGVWTAGPVPGMSTKTLFLDLERHYTTQLVRLLPGAQVPQHWHPDAEECYLVEGSFQVDTQTFHAGDYIRMPAGSAHNIITSGTGCLLLVTASLDESPQP